jgi:hypothetical protein
MAYVACPGCGRAFKGERGLRAHQATRYVSLACRPITTTTTTTEKPKMKLSRAYGLNFHDTPVWVLPDSSISEDKADQETLAVVLLTRSDLEYLTDLCGHDLGRAAVLMDLAEAILDGTANVND